MTHPEKSLTEIRSGAAVERSDSKYVYAEIFLDFISNCSDKICHDDKNPDWGTWWLNW